MNRWAIIGCPYRDIPIHFHPVGQGTFTLELSNMPGKPIVGCPYRDTPHERVKLTRSVRRV